MNQTIKRWAKRTMLVAAILIALLVLIVIPLGGSLLITNSRFRFRERGPTTPEDVGLNVTPVSFNSSDRIELQGWWSPGVAGKPVIIFTHGLNRSRLEMLQRAAEANK